MQLTARLVLLTSFIVLMFNAGVRFSIGLVLKPMAEDLLWSRAEISLAVTVFMVLSALALPFAGRLVDRLGAGKVLGVSVVLMSVGTAAMASVSSPLQALWWYGIVVAIGSAGTSIAPIGVLVSRWFPDRIGLANSIAISGMGVGQLVIIFALAAWLDALSWRGAFVALGVANIVVVLPLVVFAARRVPDEHPDGPVQHGGPPTALNDVLRAPFFWWLLVLYAICGFHDFFMATHIVAFGLDEGLPELLAGNMLALMGLTGLIGVLMTGYLTERAGPWLPTLICFVARILLFMAVLISRDTVVIFAAALLFGLTFWITAPLTVVFVRERFGSAVLGTAAGSVTMVHHIAGGIGALVAGRLYDSTGSYDGAFMIALGLSVAALLCVWRLRRL